MKSLLKSKKSWSWSKFNFKNRIYFFFFNFFLLDPDPDSGGKINADTCESGSTALEKPVQKHL